VAYVLLGVSLVPAQTGAVSADATLTVEQDNANVERKISRFFRDVHSLRADVAEYPDNPDNRFVRVAYKPEGVPPIDIIVDCLSLRTDEQTGQIQKQTISITYYFVLDETKKTDTSRAALLEFINSFHNRFNFPGRFHLDKDGDIAFEQYVTLPGIDIAVPTEMVYEAVIRATDAWDEFAKLYAEQFPAQQ